MESKEVPLGGGHWDVVEGLLEVKFCEECPRAICMNDLQGIFK